MTPHIAEGDAVTLHGLRGEVLDQGAVLWVSHDRQTAHIRWTAAGGLRAAERVDLRDADVRRVAPRAEEVRRAQ